MTPTFQPADELLSPLSLKYVTFCTIHSYICDNVRRLSGEPSIARAINSAYDELPHALRLDVFFFVVADDDVPDSEPEINSHQHWCGKNSIYFLHFL